MNNEEKNTKKLVSALADLVIVWMIDDTERKENHTKGAPKNGTFKIRRSWPENPGSN